MAKPPKSLTFTATGTLEMTADGGFVMRLDNIVASPPKMQEITFTATGTMEGKADGGFLMTLDAQEYGSEGPPVGAV